MPPTPLQFYDFNEPRGGSATKGRDSPKTLNQTHISLHFYFINRYLLFARVPIDPQQSLRYLQLIRRCRPIDFHFRLFLLTFNRRFLRAGENVSLSRDFGGPGMGHAVSPRNVLSIRLLYRYRRPPTGADSQVVASPGQRRRSHIDRCGRMASESGETRGIRTFRNCDPARAYLRRRADESPRRGVRERLNREVNEWATHRPSPVIETQPPRFFTFYG